MSRHLDPDLLLHAYRIGAFPMADSVDAEDVYWVEPRRRGVIPLDRFHLSRSLARTLRQERFTVTVDTDFGAVMRACAEASPGRDDSWINGTILEAYGALHARGHAHSVECRQDGRLVGGLYGVRLGAAFFGESMFSRVRDASKVALAHLVARLGAGGFRLLDTQFLTGHLASFGAVELSRAAYRTQLDGAVALPADFFALEAAAGLPATTVSGPVPGKLIAQLLTQTS